MQTAENEATAAIVQMPKAAAPLAPATTLSRAALMRAQMDAETEIRVLVKEYVAKHMVEDTDFGVIPGTKKPTLLKPGAEKLVDLFNVEPTYEVVTRLEDWDRGLFHYEMRALLKERGTGAVRAEGMGSANSREGRYRWRQGERTCPACGKAAIIKGNAKYGGGWLCWAKRDGCGAKFANDDAAIVDQTVGKIENDDIFTLVNTILKMAKKRALVDAAIALARCSDIFTQDVEDLVDAGHELERSSKPAAQQQQPKSTGSSNGQQAKVPRFKKSAKWPGADQWNGKPLTEAPLDTLTLYFEAASAAVSAESDPRIRHLLGEHIQEIAASIADKEPKGEPDPDPSNGADSAGDADPATEA